MGVYFVYIERKGGNREERRRKKGGRAEKKRYVGKITQKIKYKCNRLDIFTIKIVNNDINIDLEDL